MKERKKKKQAGRLECDLLRNFWHYHDILSPPQPLHPSNNTAAQCTLMAAVPEEDWHAVVCLRRR